MPSLRARNDMGECASTKLQRVAQLLVSSILNFEPLYVPGQDKLPSHHRAFKPVPEPCGATPPIGYPAMVTMLHSSTPASRCTSATENLLIDYTDAVWTVLASSPFTNQEAEPRRHPCFTSIKTSSAACLATTTVALQTSHYSGHRRFFIASALRLQPPALAPLSAQVSSRQHR
jgi:hypothetical protein